MQTRHAPSAAVRHERRHTRRGLGKLVVAMAIMLATVTATQSTAVAAGNEAKPVEEFSMSCVKFDGTGWFFDTNSEERVAQAMDDCLKDGGFITLWSHG